MRLLLDTHALLWWLDDDPALSEVAREGIADPNSEVLVSAASVWEAEIKAATGRLDLRVDLLDQIAINRFVELPVTARSAVEAARLPLHHRDPFDRMLIAQARVEGLRLVTRDARVASYDVATLW